MPTSGRMPVNARVSVPVSTSSRSRLNKRRNARQRIVDSMTPARRTSTQRWCNIDSNLLDWRFITSQLITAMLCCAFCAVVELGGDNKFVLIPKSHVAAVPPALFYNAPLASYMSSTDGEHWISCPTCLGHPSIHGRLLPTLSAPYVQDVLDIPENLLQGLSLINLGVDIESKYHGFHTGVMSRLNVLSGPFVVQRGRRGTMDNSEAASRLGSILHQNLNHNILLQTYKCCLELSTPVVEFPVLPP
jgi:hypothetical protein